MSFKGTFDHTLDAKNRLTVPSKFRTALSGPVFVLRGLDPCLSVYPGATYTPMVEQSLAGLNPLGATARNLHRFYNSRVDEVELDGAGRLTLTARQLRYAGISDREAVIVGAGGSLEIWDPGAWERKDSEMFAMATEQTAQLDHPA